MVPSFRSSLLCVCVAALAFSVACGKKPHHDPDPTPDPIPEEPVDSGVTEQPDAGPVVPPGPSISDVKSIGAFLGARTKTVLVGDTVTFIGHEGAVVDPAEFGRPSTDSHIRAGLVAVKPNGDVHVYTKDDGLPTMKYADEFADYGDQTTTIYDLDWVTKDQNLVAAGWDYVIRGDKTVNGSWTFASIVLRAPNATVNAHIAHIVAAGTEIYAGTDQGVAVLDTTSFSVKRWEKFGVSMTGPWVYDLEKATIGGKTMVGALFGPANGQEATQLGLVEVGQTPGTAYTFPTSFYPTALEAVASELLIGMKTDDGRGSVWTASSDGTTISVQEKISADALSTGVTGAIIPNKLAFDAKHETLFVGGRIIPGGLGGGFVKVPMAIDGTVGGTAEDVVDINSPAKFVVPNFVDVLEVDDSGRLYLAGRQLCSESKLKTTGLYRWDRDDFGSWHTSRLYVSGVRDIAVDPVNQDTWLALRDGNPGLGCFGVQVQQGVCRLKKDGSCEMYFPYANIGTDSIIPTPGVSSIAFGDPLVKEFAFATRGDATFARSGDSTRAMQTQFDPSLSLHMTKAAFGGQHKLWLGSELEYETYNDPTLDETAINDRGPHGLGYVEMDSTAKAKVTRRYVRKAPDSSTVTVIEGLPSNTVWDVIPLVGDKKALVACGVERMSRNADHVQPAVSPKNISGGLALVDGDTVTKFAPPSGLTFSDVVSLAKRSDGTFLALDSTMGILTVDVEHKTTTQWVAAAWPTTERALSMAVDSQNHIAVGTTGGVYVFGTNTGFTKVTGLPAQSFAWSVKFMGPGVLYAGTDDGLVRLAIDGEALPAVLGPDTPFDPELWPLAFKCSGDEGCTCSDVSDCLWGLDCGCDKNSGACTCQQPDPCIKDPGGRDCSCVQGGTNTCNAGMSCACDASTTTCQCEPDPTLCTGTSGCPCTDGFACATGWYCNKNIGQCNQRQACDANCSCATTSTCSDGMICRGGFAGFSCVEQ